MTRDEADEAMEFELNMERECFNCGHRLPKYTHKDKKCHQIMRLCGWCKEVSIYRYWPESKLFTSLTC